MGHPKAARTRGLHGSKPEMLMPKENPEHRFAAAIKVDVHSFRRPSLPWYSLCLFDSA